MSPHALQTRTSYAMPIVTCAPNDLRRQKRLFVRLGFEPRVNPFKDALLHVLRCT